MNGNSYNEWICSEEEAGTRLDNFLNRLLKDTSRSKIQDWLSRNCFTVNGASAKKNKTLKAGDIIAQVFMPEPHPQYTIPEDIALDVIYEDEHLIVVNKPSGLVVHPGSGIRQGTLANALAFRCSRLSGMSGKLRPGIVHRLDKNTTGLLVAAKNDIAHLRLAEQLQKRKVKRIYRALVWRQMSEETGSISAPVGRCLRNREKMTVHEDGKPALTFFTVDAYYSFASLLRVELGTGRTHQIRVHFSHLGYPLVGDALYGGGKFPRDLVSPQERAGAAALLRFFPFQALHAGKLVFRHPQSGEEMVFNAPLPKLFQEALSYLEPYKV